MDAPSSPRLVGEVAQLNAFLVEAWCARYSLFRGGRRYLAVRRPSGALKRATGRTGQSPGQSDAAYALTTEIIESLNSTTWPDDVDTQLSARSDWDEEVQRCSDPSTFVPEGCTYGGGSKVALVIGDSLARAYTPAYKRALDPDEWTIVQMTLNGCEFSTDLLASERSVEICEAHNQAAIAASKALSPDAVLVTSQWARHRVLGQEQDIPFDEWWNGARAALDEIESPIVYVAPPPFEKSIESCYSALALPADCISEVSSAWNASESALEEYASSNDDVVFVDSRDWFCYEDRCPAFVKGELTRSDLVHPGQPFLESAESVITEAIVRAVSKQ